MFTTDTVVLSDTTPLKMIDSLYRYYEKAGIPMTVGELYLMLKLLVSKLEDEMEKMGINISEMITNEN